MTQDCPNIESNMEDCNCTYSGCPRKGKCCECVTYHRNRGELPACFFPDDVEKTFDRSIGKFVEVMG
ncbi:MAG: DUF6485 family protein [Candidatus Aenigmatarchaeota archaeon]